MMNVAALDLAAVDLDEYWTAAAQEAVQRMANLARRVIRAPVCLVYAAEQQRRTLRHVSGGPRHLADAALHNAMTDAAFAARSSLEVAIRTAGGGLLGTLVLFDELPREWTADEQALAGELAQDLGRQIELHAEVERLALAPRAALSETFQAVVDNIPGILFERRKVDAAHCAYTFFGARKATLPAVQQLMSGGGSAAYSFVHRDDREKIRDAILRSTVEETDLDLTFRIKDFGDRLTWVRSQAVVRHEDGVAVWSGVCVDITDLVAALGAGESDPASAPAVADRELRPSPAANVASPPDEDPRAPADGEEASIGEGTRILLADDLDLNRKLIADMLSLDGNIVDCVADGAAAVKAAAEKDYDLILMDMIMPGMDGIAATRAIRALPGPSGSVPIVALTAHSFREQLDSCLEAGMDATLTKPMTLDALTAAVATWTRRRSKAA